MIPRILTGAALTGMVLATGCGGGTGSSGGITPTTTGSGATSIARGAAVFHVLVPIPRAVASKTSSSSRSPKYISPGSSGIQVLLGNNTLAGTQFIIGTTSAPAAIPGSVVPGVGSTTTSALSTTVNGNSAGGAQVSYAYALSSQAGYYNMTISLTGLAASTAETVGVVLTDILHNNYVLSEGQGTLTTSASLTAPVKTLSIPLAPVLAKAYLVGPGPAIVIGGTAATPTALGYQFTAYAADELGYPIPKQTAVNFENGTFGVAQYQGAGLTSTVLTTGFNFLTAVPPLGSNTSLNPPQLTGIGVTANTFTTAVLPPGSTSATSTAETAALAVGTELLFGASDYVTVTAVGAAGGGIQSITFTPALTAYDTSASVIGGTSTITALSGVAGTGTTWSSPGSAISNLAFAQASGTPTITGVTGYTAGQAVLVVATAAGTYGVAAVANFAQSGSVLGYTYNYGVNYPATATAAIISTPSSFTVPGGFGVGISAHARKN